MSPGGYSHLSSQAAQPYTAPSATWDSGQTLLWLYVAAKISFYLNLCLLILSPPLLLQPLLTVHWLTRRGRDTAMLVAVASLTVQSVQWWVGALRIRATNDFPLSLILGDNTKILECSSLSLYQ